MFLFLGFLFLFHELGVKGSVFFYFLGIYWSGVSDLRGWALGAVVFLFLKKYNLWWYAFLKFSRFAAFFPYFDATICFLSSPLYYRCNTMPFYFTNLCNVLYSLYCYDFVFVFLTCFLKILLLLNLKSRFFLWYCCFCLGFNLAQFYGLLLFVRQYIPSFCSYPHNLRVSASHTFGKIFTICFYGFWSEVSGW